MKSNSVMGTKTDMTKSAMLEALERSLGVVSTACKKVGISRNTHYDYMKTDPDYKAAVDALKDVALDFAESQLHKQISEGSTAATIFYLKTQGKGRGYIERQEMEVSNPEGKEFKVKVIE